VCFSGMDSSMYVDLYNGEVNIVLAMVNAGFAAKSQVVPGMVQLSQSFDSNSSSVPSTTNELEYVLIPG